MVSHFRREEINPHLDGYFADARGVLEGLSSSVPSVGNLLTRDYPEFIKRVLRNKVPIDLVKALMDRLPEKDYHREGNPKLFSRHGFLTGAASMKYLGQAFPPPWGINSHQYDFSGNLSDLSGRLLPKIEDAKNAGEDVHFLAHSFGALIGLHAYQQRPELFDRILTMAVPYHGSEMADKYWLPLLLLPIIFPPSLLLPSIDVRKFKTTSPVLADFRNKGLPEDAPILNLYSDGDEFIKPYTHALLPEQSNITNLCIPGIKHNHFIYDPLVREVAKMFLNGMDMGYRMPDHLDQALSFKQTARIEELVLVNDL